MLNYLLRLNLIKETEQSASKVLSLGNNPGWRFPDDASVDLAALPIAPTNDIFDYEVIPTDEMATQSLMASRNVVEGDSVLFSGLFIQYVGQMKMEPIVRTGTLAMLPEEQIQTTLHKLGRVYLAEAHAFGGNSGSPMFINLGGMRLGAFSPSDYKLLGVVAGEFFETENLELKAASSFKGNIQANSGISMVVPADEILKLLNSPDLVAVREATIAKLPKH